MQRLAANVTGMTARDLKNRAGQRPSRQPRPASLNVARGEVPVGNPAFNPHRARQPVFGGNLGAVGIDGPGLYQDDTGSDVRAEAKELMAQGLSPVDVTATLAARWKDVLGDEDVYCAFHLALADTQCRVERRDPDVVRTALDLIDSGRDLRRWEYSQALYARRRGVLSQLAGRLVAPPGAERKVRVPRVFRTSLAVGDVFVRTTENGERFLLHVIGLNDTGRDLYALLEILDWDWTQQLGREAVEGARPTQPAGHLNNRIHLAPFRGTDMPKKQTQMMGNWKPVRPDPRPAVGGVVAWAGSYLDGILRSIVRGGSGQI
jgi:hypothetical protein